MRAVSRMAGSTYGRIGEGFEISRPVWSEVEGEVANVTKKK
jgi:hypothetical protein